MRPTNVAMSGMPTGKSWMGWWGDFAGPKQKGVISYSVFPLTNNVHSPGLFMGISSMVTPDSLHNYLSLPFLSVWRIRLGQQERCVLEQQSRSRAWRPLDSTYIQCVVHHPNKIVLFFNR
ncbi:UcrQ domain-containing protein [Rhizoctonia solani AG-1 IA]|uniref:UcrQ domain-containing protein n=1 Tax=Thanatephorus cucumeris (strain AG1-IA) TaxID=983506 RepID=L8WPF4_THACA|nr:UcrQ domain-containing protein [Rhizoctonia solani AG-1 IA]